MGKRNGLNSVFICSNVSCKCNLLKTVEIGFYGFTVGIIQDRSIHHVGYKMQIHQRHISSLILLFYLVWL